MESISEFIARYTSGAGAGTAGESEGPGVEPDTGRPVEVDMTPFQFRLRDELDGAVFVVIGDCCGVGRRPYCW